MSLIFIMPSVVVEQLGRFHFQLIMNTEALDMDSGHVQVSLCW